MGPCQRGIASSVDLYAALDGASDIGSVGCDDESTPVQREPQPVDWRYTIVKNLVSA
jgi:hypothetical protein